MSTLADAIANPAGTPIGGAAAGIGAPADVAATTDTGTFSLIALLKRALGYLATMATAATSTASSPVNDSNTGNVKACAASATTTLADGGAGATGDWLSHIIIVPTSTTPGAVQIQDGASTAITIYTGGTVDAALKPIELAIDAKSKSGAWKIILGANETAVGFGRF